MPSYSFNNIRLELVMEIQALQGQTAPPTQFIRILCIDPQYVEIHMGFWIHLIIASIIWQLTLGLTITVPFHDPQSSPQSSPIPVPPPALQPPTATISPAGSTHSSEYFSPEVISPSTRSSKSEDHPDTTGSEHHLEGTNSLGSMRISPPSRLANRPDTPSPLAVITQKAREIRSNVSSIRAIPNWVTTTVFPENALILSLPPSIQIPIDFRPRAAISFLNDGTWRIFIQSVTSQIRPQQHHEAYTDYVENNLLDYLRARNNFPRTESLAQWGALRGYLLRILDRLHEVAFPSHEERRELLLRMWNARPSNLFPGGVTAEVLEEDESTLLAPSLVSTARDLIPNRVMTYQFRTTWTSSPDPYLLSEILEHSTPERTNFYGQVAITVFDRTFRQTLLFIDPDYPSMRLIRSYSETIALLRAIQEITVHVMERRSRETSRTIHLPWDHEAEPVVYIRTLGILLAVPQTFWFTYLLVIDQSHLYPHIFQYTPVYPLLSEVCLPPPLPLPSFLSSR